ncbi:MAG TPA: TIGR03435 family protein [Bryobacteraceae bacterium]|nr:TIGR03435 family protein [Bryobacteraceae bacterium]
MRAVVLLLWTAAAVGQPKPKFDVVSVKPCDTHEPRSTNMGSTSPGRVRFNCVSLTTYIRQAYGFHDNGVWHEGGHTLKIEGGPAWVNTDEFRIDATASATTNPNVLDGPMMQSLLEERFKLKVHRETREVPVYALVGTKGGLKAPPAKVACFAPGSGPPTWRPGVDQPPPLCSLGKPVKGGLEIYGVTMPQFCLAVWRTAISDRTIIDRTGIAGRFDLDLRWPSEDEDVRTAEGRFDRLQGALSRIGLKLVEAKGSGEFIVIDHAERPTAN